MRRGLLLVILVLILMSCKNDVPKQELYIDQVENLGLSLENKVEKADIRAINKLYDEKAFAELFLMKSTKKRIHEFNVGFFAGFSRSFSFGEILVSLNEENTSYNFIRAYQDKNEDFHMLFRMYSAVGGLNYHDYLVRTINGEPKIIDMYVYISGENLSDSYRTYYKSLLYNSDLFSKDVSEISTVKDLEKLAKIKELNARGEYKKSQELYKKITSTSKQTKAFKLINIMTAFNLSEDDYYNAIKDYEDKFPNDPSLYLISIDRLILKKEYDKCFSNINKLDSLLGVDPFLNFLRGNVYYHKGEYDNALGKYAIVNLEFPEFLDAYDNALNIYLETKQNKKAIEILDLYVSDFQLDKEELKHNLQTDFTRFVNTKEFKDWFSKK